MKNTIEDNFIVSTVIPVYNAEEYLVECIESVLQLSEVGELLLIDDGSSDSSLKICQDYASKDKRVSVLQHEHGVNKGRSASKNLGIINAQFKYISFLDSDDLYLPERFSETVSVFRSNLELDGVYEAIGIYFKSDTEKKLWHERYNFELTTVSRNLNGRKLFKSILWDTHGHFSGNGLTIKKSAFDKCGLFPDFKTSEDTHLFLRMALTCNLAAGNIKSETGLRRVHGLNSVLEDERKISNNLIKVYRDLLTWIQINKMGILANLEIRMRLLLQQIKHSKLK